METLRDSTTRASVAGSNVAVYMRHVYNWMTVGLLVTAASAWFVAGNPTMQSLIYGSQWSFLVLVLATFGMVMWISAGIQNMSAGMATGAFVAYSALNGAMISSVLLVYTGASIVNAFVITAGTFLAMSIYGAVTKRDLTSMGSFMFMGLIGVIIASLVNLFLQSPAMSWVLSALCVVIFTGLTAYDTQKIRAFGEAAPVDDTVAMRRGAILGALTLYLDFLNLFLAVLRIFGDRR